MSTRPVIEVSVADFRRGLAHQINTVQTRGATVYLTSRGRRVAALVPVADAERLDEGEQRPIISPPAVREAADRFHVERRDEGERTVVPA